jgi:hypothetical protein
MAHTANSQNGNCHPLADALGHQTREPKSVKTRPLKRGTSPLSPSVRSRLHTLVRDIHHLSKQSRYRASELMMHVLMCGLTDEEWRELDKLIEKIRKNKRS